MPGVRIRVDAKTGETMRVLPNGTEKRVNPNSANYVGEKVAPSRGARSDTARRVRNLNRHLRNSNSNSNQ